MSKCKPLESAINFSFAVQSTHCRHHLETISKDKIKLIPYVQFLMQVLKDITK